MRCRHLTAMSFLPCPSQATQESSGIMYELSVGHCPCGVDISLQCLSFPVHQSLSNATREAADSPPTIRHLTSSIHTVLHLPGKHFPSFSPSVSHNHPSTSSLPASIFGRLPFFHLIL